ncbi:RNA polymerase II-associated protein 3-like [Physella acuta]|uniref:RNA polymerase II-associated protein 3-like n=1 Tax=Physella acuta TaxID=109671 RepID=UPI0027DC3C67|nr:RNA polymerase II-associated protein 3-like [Physella acuta]XP_059168623.1 RNA polymerase II-associated protein 3-like [Physella acuta]XP_059168624.1 RNA polymerase II-associated protein 3-like [Physella acuta]
MPKISEHEEKMIRLQSQVRLNQTELQDYLSDLKNWEKDIKRKEEDLKLGKTDKSEELPPVRNTIHKKKLKRKKKEKPVNHEKPKKISGFDFRAWDKFDVEKALEEVDKEDKGNETSSSEYETDEEWEFERKKYLAGLEKDKGNEFFKNGDIENAVEAYTKGISYDPTNAILPANRAMALLKQEKYGAAELDCTTSITLDPLYVKSYLRRATARTAMGKFKEASEDFQRVLYLEPTNKHAAAELDRLKKEFDRENKDPVLSSLIDGKKGIVKPVYKPPEERSKVPLRQVLIEEVGIEVGSRLQCLNMEQSETAKKLAEQEGEKFDQLFLTSESGASSISKIEELSSTPSESLDNKRVGSSSSVDSSVQSSDSSDRGQADVRSEKCGDSTISPKKKDSCENSSNKKFSPEIGSGDRTATTAQTKASQTRVATEASPGDSFSVPTTSFQFQADFKLLKHNQEAFINYFKAIPPAKYCQLFGQCLDAEILTTILTSLQTNSNRLDEINMYDILINLTKVKRFSMTAMFLSQKEKQVIKDLLQALDESKKYSENDLTALRKCFL